MHLIKTKKFPRHLHYCAGVGLERTGAAKALNMAGCKANHRCHCQIILIICKGLLFLNEWLSRTSHVYMHTHINKIFKADLQKGSWTREAIPEQSALRHLKCKQKATAPCTFVQGPSSVKSVSVQSGLQAVWVRWATVLLLPSWRKRLVTSQVYEFLFILSPVAFTTRY